MSAMTEAELKDTLRLLYVHNSDTSDAVDVPALWAQVHETMRAFPEADQQRIAAWVAVHLPERRPGDQDRRAIEEERFAFSQWLERQHHED